MDTNKYKKDKLIQIKISQGNKYFISRDKMGNHVLREGSSDGKELFSPVRDNGKKNTKTGRVTDVNLLYDMIKRFKL